MPGLFCALTALAILAAPTFAAIEVGQSNHLDAGQVVYLSTRLESVTKSPGKKVIAGWSRGDTGIEAWKESGPYAVEACTPLKVRKVVADKSLVVIRDQAGIKHTLAGDWSGWIHAGETECREQLKVRPGATVLENGKLRYELPGPPGALDQAGAVQSTPP